MAVTGLGEKVIVQIGVVVQDAEHMAGQYARILGVNAPQVQISEAYDQTQAHYHGQPTAARAKIACFDFGQVQYELLQPVGEPSAWMDFLKQSGDGIHHVAFGVSGSDVAAASFVEHGYPIIQQGFFSSRAGRYTYLDTERDLSMVIELLERFGSHAPSTAAPFPADKGIGTNSVCQVGLIVEDIERTAQKYADVLGVPLPPIVTTAGYEVSKTTYNGEPSEATAKLAFFGFGQLQLELIEPDEKPSIWREFLESKGPGAQHIAFVVKDTQQATTYLANYGIGIAQQGLYSDGGGMYTYLRSEDALGVVIELLENF